MSVGGRTYMSDIGFPLPLFAAIYNHYSKPTRQEVRWLMHLTGTALRASGWCFTELCACSIDWTSAWVVIQRTRNSSHASAASSVSAVAGLAVASGKWQYIIIKLPDQAIASTPSALPPPLGGGRKMEHRSIMQLLRTSQAFTRYASGSTMDCSAM
jgi:hypothetical protein